MLCATLQAHSQWRHPIQTEVSTRTPSLSSESIFSDAFADFAPRAPTATPNAAVLKKSRLSRFFHKPIILLNNNLLIQCNSKRLK